MISVSTDNYFNILCAAPLQAVRTGMSNNI